MEEDLRAEEEQARQTLDNNMDEALQGTTTSFEDDEQVRVETDVEEDEDIRDTVGDVPRGGAAFLSDQHKHRTLHLSRPYHGGAYMQAPLS
jgi:hypothetical protein